MRLFSLLLISCIYISACHGHNYREEEGETIERSGDDDSDEEDESGSDCGYEDGTHSATVDYYNPETGHSATYDLEVEVQDCEVTQINFPKGGWMDEDHIDPAALDEDGNANVEDDRGRSWDIHLN